jgi:hypothetical protein
MASILITGSLQGTKNGSLKLMHAWMGGVTHAAWYMSRFRKADVIRLPGFFIFIS